MLEGFFDFTQPVGLEETLVSIVVVVFAMWAGFFVLKCLKKKIDSK